MSRFTDAMRRSGWGTDPYGDAARRESMRASAFSPYLRDALAAEADRIAADAHRQIPRTAGDPPPVPGHRIRTERHGSAIVARCECGRWDGGWTGPRSRRRVMDDHAEHVAAELSADGPIKVVAVRLDQPKEIEP